MNAATGTELRASGRIVRGVGLPYNRVSPWLQEMFEGGGAQLVDVVELDIEHDFDTAVAWTGNGLTVEDTADGLMIEATLPETRAGHKALRGVVDGSRSGLSVEFDSLRDRRDPQSGLRIVEEYLVRGFGLTSAPSYPDAQVTELRQRSGPGVSGQVSLGENLSCNCLDGCTSRRYTPDSFDAALQEAAAGDRVIPMFFSGRFDRPLASVGGGVTVTRQGRQLQVALDGLPDTPEVAEFLESIRNGNGFQIRPYTPARSSTYAKIGEVAEFTLADLRGFELAAISGPVQGLQRIRVEGIPETRSEVEWWLW